MNLSNSLGRIPSCAQGSVEQLMEGAHKGAVCSFPISSLSEIFWATTNRISCFLFSPSLSGFCWLCGSHTACIRHYPRHWLECSWWRSLNTALCHISASLLIFKPSLPAAWVSSLWVFKADVVATLLLGDMSSLGKDPNVSLLPNRIWSQVKDLLIELFVMAEMPCRHSSGLQGRRFREQPSLGPTLHLHSWRYSSPPCYPQTF